MRPSPKSVGALPRLTLQQLPLDRTHLMLHVCVLTHGNKLLRMVRMTNCRAAGCVRRTTRHGALCDLHKMRKRRHGAPDQQGVTKAKLKPFIGLVRARIKKNATSTVWKHLEDRWATVVSHSQERVAHWKRGNACVRTEITASEEVIRVAEHVEPREVVVTALAMYLMQYRTPTFFRSDRAFQVQLVRRVRGLTEANAARYTDQLTGKTKRAYRELPPRSAAYMADWLVQAFGATGVKLAHLERDEEEKRKAEGLEFGKALADLT